MAPIDIHTFSGLNNAPTLVLVDLQQEYICEHRPLGLSSATPALENCKRLLAAARHYKIPVAFMRWSQDGTVFNRNGRFSDWIEGLSPTKSDMVFERRHPSCYASKEFCSMMRDGGGEHVIIAGLTSSVACLATIVDGVTNQHRYIFAQDASASHAHNGKNENEVHDLACFFISIFGMLKSTSQVIAEFESSVSQFPIKTRGHHNAFG